MVSRMAVDDCEGLISEGYKLTCEDIIRLNALGVKAERGPDSASFYALQRCAFVGEICFREPTIGHEIWYDQVSRQFDTDDDITDFCLRAFMMSREADNLPDSHNPTEVKLQLDKFTKKTIAKLTLRQIMSAVSYCSQGCDSNDGEIPVQKNKPEEEEKSGESIAVGIIREGQALGLGISLSDVKKMTRSELQSVIIRAYDLKQLPISDSIRKDCLGDYFTTLQEIKNRLEKENG